MKIVAFFNSQMIPLLPIIVLWPGWFYVVRKVTQLLFVSHNLGLFVVHEPALRAVITNN